MKSFLRITIVSVLFLTTLCNAQIEQKNSERFGIGIQTSAPIIGLSAIYKVTPSVGIQGLLGFISTMKYYGIKGNYYLDAGSAYTPYVFVMGGSASYTILDQSESIFAFGVGGGMEYVTDHWGFSAELGYGSFNFTAIDANVSSIIAGVGIHYYLF